MQASRLKKLREEMRFTQEELAEKIGAEVLQIYRWENGKTKPNADWVAKLASALNVSADYLLGLSEYQTPHEFVRSELSLKERAVIAAWRRGERMEAVRVIANDDETASTGK